MASECKLNEWSNARCWRNRSRTASAKQQIILRTLRRPPTPGTPASHSSEAAWLEPIFPPRKAFNPKANKRSAGALLTPSFAASMCCYVFACRAKCEDCASITSVNTRVLLPWSRQRPHCKCRTCLLSGHPTAFSHGYERVHQHLFCAYLHVMQALPHLPFRPRPRRQHAGKDIDVGVGGRGGSATTGPKGQCLSRATCPK